jgi:hypothetical protein
MLAFFQKATPVGVVSCSGIPTRPTAPPGRAISNAVSSLLESDALEDGMRADAAGQLANALDRLVAALTNNISRAELLSERDPSRIVAEEDDLVGAQPLRSDHAAESLGAHKLRRCE